MLGTVLSQNSERLQMDYFQTLDSNIWSLNSNLITKSDNFYQNVGTAFSPKSAGSVKHYVIIGTGIQTLQGYFLRPAIEADQSFLQYEGKKVVLDPVFGDGDGTVPLKSADLQGSTQTYYINHEKHPPAAHGELTSNVEVQALVKAILENVPYSQLYQSPTTSKLIDIEPSVDFTLGGARQKMELKMIDHSFSEDAPVPDWIRNNAKWWVEGTIDDGDFTSGIQYLIKEDIIRIPETVSSTSNGSQEIPGWIKNNADWWAQGLITDDDFLKGIQYLVEQGIIKV